MKFWILILQIRPRVKLQTINCGTDAESVTASVEKLWGDGTRVIAIREATAEETETIKDGYGVKF